MAAQSKAMKPRFVRTCELMASHWSRFAPQDTHWERQSEHMLQRIAAYPEASPFSSELYVLDHFGGGNMRPDRNLLRRSLQERALGRYQRAVRRRLGYGRLGDILLGPFGDVELHRRTLSYAAVSYDDAVRTGYELFREAIEEFDVRSPTLFEEQAVSVADARRLAWLTLVSLKRVLLVRREAGHVDRMLEIGAGTGEFARLMLATGTAQRVTIIDIPPALAVAQELFLSQYSADRLALFDPDRRELPADAACAFLTPDQASLASKAELCVNFASFGEMTRDTVAEYALVVKRARIPQLISINTRKPHPVAEHEHVDESFYERTFAPELRIVRRARWSKGLDLELLPHDDQYSGYQWLHFRPCADHNVTI